MSYFQPQHPSFLQQLEEDIPSVPLARQYVFATRDIGANHAGYAGPSVSRQPQFGPPPLLQHPSFPQYPAAPSYLPLYAAGGPTYLVFPGCPPMVAPFFMAGDLYRHARQIPPPLPTHIHHHDRYMNAFGSTMPHYQPPAGPPPQQNTATVHSYTPASYPAEPVSHGLSAPMVQDVKPIIIDNPPSTSRSRAREAESTSARHRFRPIRPRPAESGVGPIRSHRGSEGTTLKQDTTKSRMSVKRRKAADRPIPESAQVPGLRELPQNPDRPRKARGAALGTTPYGCDSCGQCYGREADLTRHLQSDRQHKKPAFKCDSCGTRCGRKDVLMKHKRESCSAR